MKKEKYSIPEIEISKVCEDIITYSETEEWFGPEIEANNAITPES